ncbi:MAG TPA: SMP-30/gluconolactonase/LRE family protein [Steroidobacteraceae bacterium]|jgi:gluconolactonase|nr:SMP-30/gluconolactonase/LRE family protein [Steroidobacteraceae bacterium]
MKARSLLALWSMLSTVTLIGVSRADTVLVDATAAYPEGPLWRDGKLLYVEYAGPGIKMWDGKEIKPYWSREHCGASGLIAYRRNHILVACYDANEIVELDETGKQIRAVDRDSAGKPFVGPNDFTADAAGGVYVSASGVYDLKAPISGTILYLSKAEGTLVEVANLIHYSNGLALSKDGKSLLVAEMLAGRILSFPVKTDGTLGPRTVWARMQDLAPPTPHEDAYNGPDGLKLGPDGNYYIAQNGSGRVLVVNDAKKLVRIITVPTPYVTNMNFGADGTATVYITGVFDPWKAPFPGAVYRWTK